MQPFFTSILTTTFGGQFAPKKGGQFDRIFHLETTAKLTTNFRFKLTTDFRSKLTSGFRSKLTT